MDTLPHVLCFGNDAALLETRRWVLERRYPTVCVGSLAEMNVLRPDECVDVVVLCHSLHAAECAGACRTVRARWGRAKILALTAPSGGCHTEHADLLLPTLAGPGTLLDTIGRLFAQQQTPIS